MSVRETALAFDRAARQSRVDYAFMGAFAVMTWGEPRATTDVDTLVRYASDQIPGFVVALRSVGFSVDPRDLVDALHDGSHVTVHHEGSVFWIDLKPARTAVERQQIDQSAEISVGEARLRIVRPEETIAFKLKFGTPKDEQDAFSILVRQAGRLDEGRLHEFATRLGVLSRLREMEKDIAAGRT